MNAADQEMAAIIQPKAPLSCTNPKTTSLEAETPPRFEDNPSKPQGALIDIDEKIFLMFDSIETLSQWR